MLASGVDPAVAALIEHLTDVGYRAAVNAVHPHDLSRRCSTCLGSTTRLTNRYRGRDFRLTDVHGKVIRDILA